MIDTISGNIGFLEPLDSLRNQFTGSEVQQRKINEFATEFGGWRRCRGDGNCFYRACGFAFIEALLWKEPKSLRPFLEVVRSCGPETESLVSLALPLCELEPAVALERLYRTIFVDKAVDASLVKALRLVSSGFLKEHADAEFNGLPLNVYVEASHGMSLDAFCTSELMANGVEAESVALTLPSMAFKLKIEIIQLDRSDSSSRYTLPDGAAGDATATLLFKPGHYDIFYRRDMAAGLLELQGRLRLDDCKIKATCPICMDEIEVAASPPCGCVYCEECLSGLRTSGATDCAVCGKAMPPCTAVSI